VGSGFAGRSLELQGARSFGDAVVVEVKSLSPDGKPRADYWRATAYDRYTSVGGPDVRTWADTTGQAAAATLGLANEEQARTPVGAGEQMPQRDLSGREVITQTFTFRQNFSQPTLLAATQPISISLPINVKHTFTEVDGQTVANYGDLSLIASQRGGVRSGLTYNVSSLVSTADKQSLRSAPTQYPEWVKRYMQLPEGDTLSRVFAKAQEVAGAANNPYDKAEAIQNYLRSFTYDEKIPFPPEDRDRVDWFLFDLQRGYCDYFASAMTLMLRSKGVPARLVSGYATGAYNAEKGIFEVRQNVAHTWVEAYFPGYGWQRFEPTPASYKAPPERPDTADQANGDASGDAGNVTAPNQRELDLDELERRLGINGEDEPTSEDALARIAEQQAQQRRATLVRRGAVGSGLLVAALFGLVFLWHPRGVGPAAAAYTRALRLAKWASLGPKTSATPREFAIQLGEHLPAQRSSLDEIANAYTRERYSGGQPVAPAAVETAWRNVRWPLVGTLLSRWVGLGRRGRTQPTKRRKR
jgi:transglutaminase-like putative cysteine protease